MDARQFLDMLAAGQGAEAKDAFAELLSTKAMEALEAKKQEIASTLFNGKEDDVEQTEEPESTTETEQETE